MIVLKPEEMREVDRAAIKAGFPDLLLMETAGRGVANLADEIMQKNRGRVLIFVGRGNNGGDGLVAARFLAMYGYRVDVVLLTDEKELKGNPLINYRICQLKGINILKTTEPEEIRNLVCRADLLIDAMLGTGLKGSVREPISTLIDIINGSQKIILAVDIPSGLDGEKGQVLGKVIRADYTATMAYPKIGLIVYPGREYTGELSVIDLGVPDEYAEGTGYSHFLLTAEEAACILPARDVEGHKGTFGKVGILGGSPGMTGAPALTGMAALKIGAGLVRVAVPASIQDIVAGYSPELITIGLNGPEDYEEIQKSDVMAIGPGLGRSEDVNKLIEKAIMEWNLPLVIDADGINGIQDLKILNKRQFPLVLTPHPGEMSHLINKKIDFIQENRISIARDFATTYHLCLILKGAVTVIALPDGRVYLNQTGNEGMATAGSGDVLTGVITGLIAQGCDYTEAAVLGPYLHGLAGDLACEEYGSYSTIAGDLLRFLHAAIEVVKANDCSR